MPRPICAVIHRSALTHNLQVARAAVPDSQVYAIVKADAYGHGIERVYSAFAAADGFGFLDLAEGVRLRALGCAKPLLLLEGIFALEDLFVCTKYQLAFTVHSQYQIEWLKAFLKIQPEAQFDVFIKINTGMNRLGFMPNAYQQAYIELKQLRNVQSITQMTHFSDADGQRLGQEGVLHQYQAFRQATSSIQAPVSLSNSAAILRHAQRIHSDIVRSGIMLYGSSPSFPHQTIQDFNLKPAMTLRSEIIAIQSIQSGQSVGYGSTFIATEPMRIGVVACGYADGYQRITQTGTPVLVDSQRTQTLGRVSMDMLVVDLTHLPQTKIGSEVTLWGMSSQGVELSIDEVAQGSGTLGYELMCGVTARVPFKIEN